MEQSSAPQRIRLLVVDDEPIVGNRLRQVFTKMGYEVVIAASGAIALEHVNRQPFDIIVSDLKMDDMDGLELLSLVRERSPATKGIIITGYAEKETADQAFHDGVFDFLAKPFRLDQIKDAVIRATKVRQEEEVR